MPSIVVIAAVGLHGQHGAGLHRAAVQVDGAGAAVAGLAADMRAGETDLLAQEMDQQGARLHQSFDLAAVEGDGDLGLRHLLFSLPAQPAARSWARWMARRSMTPAILVR
jgi:hypothetical protein